MTASYTIKANTFNGPMNFDGGGTVTMEQDAYIFATGDNGIEATGGPWTFTINGVVASDISGMVLYDMKIGAPIANAKITVGSEGLVFGSGSGGDGILSQQAADITNSGWIQGDTYGVELDNTAPSTTKAITISNNAGGEIKGSLLGIYDTDASHSLTVINKGDITGIDWAGAATITNNGTIASLDQTNPSGGAVTITNTGTIGGDVDTGNGGDKLTNSGRIEGSVLLADGSNTATNSGHITGFLAGGTGNDTFTNSGQIDQSVDLQGGAKNALTNSGTIGSFVHFTSGDDTLSNTATGSIGTDVDMGQGKNSLTNGGTIGGNITFRDGADTMTNTGTVSGSVIFGDGINKLTNGGTIAGNVSFGLDADSFTNTKVVDGKVDLGDGNNTVTNSGIVVGPLLGGAGNDVVSNTGQALSNIDLGGGNDTLTGGNFRESVLDDLGNDTYHLGGGNDLLEWFAQGTDVMDGGAGTDSFDASSVANSVLLNLDTKAVTIGNQTIAADTVTSGTGHGKITGFETAEGSDFAGDILAGSAAKEVLLGLGGNDTIYGAGGADEFDGGLGSDTFVYRAITDSGTTAATRDKIDFFEGGAAAGGDTIDLSAIDANSVLAGKQSFHWIGEDTPFTHAGDLRAVHVPGGDLIVQADTNGDGKVDFSIDLVGTHDVNASDFAL